jgi:DNA-binding response OmpR family regulator
MAKKKIESQKIVKQIESLVKTRMLENKVVHLKDLNKLNHQQKLTLLIVDDDATIRNSLYRLFSEDGYKVLTAADGIELSKSLESDTPDLVILDVDLPWINGLELTELIKSHDDIKEIPIILLSGLVEKTDIKKGFAAGADDYISKPFNPDRLKQTVLTLLTLRLK